MENQPTKGGTKRHDATQTNYRVAAGLMFEIEQYDHMEMVGRTLFEKRKRKPQLRSTKITGVDWLYEFGDRFDHIMPFDGEFPWTDEFSMGVARAQPGDPILRPGGHASRPV